MLKIVWKETISTVTGQVARNYAQLQCLDAEWEKLVFYLVELWMFQVDQK